MSRTGSSLIGALALGAALLVAVIGAVTAAQDSPKDAAPASPKIRIGVYDTRAVAVASRNSEVFRAPLAALRREHQEAKAKGDTKRVAELEQRGQTLQTLRHLQAFSNGPVDDLIAGIAAELPEIARQADVCALAPTTDWHAAGVELVDVTDAITAAFHPDEATRRILADMKGKRPLPFLEILELKD